MKGVILLNVGSPKSPDVSDVRSYLHEFLMDPCVLNKPFILRWILVNLLILPTRPKQSAKAYAKIWDETEGFPLISLTRTLVEKLKNQLKVPITFGMRYAEPSINDGIQELLSLTNGQLSELYVIPMFPQYALSSSFTAVEAVKRVVKDMKLSIQLTVKEPFYEDPNYIQALFASIKPYWEDNQLDHILFSFHGLPESHLRQTDPTKVTCLSKPSCCEFDSPAIATCYRAQAFKIVNQVVKPLGLPSESYSTSFQSRLGREPWLTPFTDETVEDLAKKGVKRLGVACPSFLTDCLETIEEIGLEAKEAFLEAGGESFVLIPCLNDQDRWVSVMSTWIRDYFTADHYEQLKIQ